VIVPKAAPPPPDVIPDDENVRLVMVRHGKGGEARWVKIDPQTASGDDAVLCVRSSTRVGRSRPHDPDDREPTIDEVADDYEGSVNGDNPTDTITPPSDNVQQVYSQTFILTPGPATILITSTTVSPQSVGVAADDDFTFTYLGATCPPATP
jgi:hypothetical protein